MKSLAVSWATGAKRFSRKWLDKTRGEHTSTIAWYAGRWVGTICDWAFGTQIEFGQSPRSTNGVQALTTLLASVGTLTVGLLAYIVGEKHPGSRLIYAYIGLSLIPIIATFAIMRLTEHDSKGRRIHSFDRGAIMYARWCLVLSIATVAGASLSFHAGILPGQEPSTYELFAAKVADYKFKASHPDVDIKEGDEGLEVLVPLRRDDLARMEFPDPLYLEIRLGAEVRRSWQVSDVDGFIGGAPAKSPPQLLDEPLTKETEANERRSLRSGKYGVVWPDLGRDVVDGTLKIYMHRYKNSEVTVDELRHFIVEKNSDFFTVTAFYRK